MVPSLEGVSRGEGGELTRAGAAAGRGGSCWTRQRMSREKEYYESVAPHRVSRWEPQGYFTRVIGRAQRAQGLTFGDRAMVTCVLLFI